MPDASPAPGTVDRGITLKGHSESLIGFYQVRLGKSIVCDGQRVRQWAVEAVKEENKVCIPKENSSGELLISS